MLQLEKDGTAVLYHHDRLPDDIAERVPSIEGLKRVERPWYDGVHFPRGPRPYAMLPHHFGAKGADRVHDLPADPLAPFLFEVIAHLRRSKDPDELALLRRISAIQEQGHRFAREKIAPGMTEVEVYAGVSQAITLAAGRALIVYGDFAVSPGPERKGGPPSGRVLQEGDLFILDFSAILGGYRCDFTTTLAVGKPSARAREMMALCLQAMKAGEGKLQAGVPASAVHAAVNQVFAAQGLDRWFGHHAGHGLGLTHPEAPFLVFDSPETLVKNDVITLEPGLYIPDQGGMRIERNYRITEGGYETLSFHSIDFD